MKIRLTSTILIRGINPYVAISAAQAGKLKPNWRRPMPVVVRVNGEPPEAWRINMMPRGDGGFYLYLHGAVRAASKTKVGDRVAVEVAFDADHRNGPQHEMPAAFAAALTRVPKAEEAWAALPPSRQKEILRYLATLKSEEAKARNVERALHVLSGGQGRFMARDWKNGR